MGLSENNLCYKGTYLDDFYNQIIFLPAKLSSMWVVAMEELVDW